MPTLKLKIIHMESKYFIIDWDSTVTTVEGLDMLAAIALKDEPEKVKAIEEITNAGMDGQKSFHESLTERVKLLCANRAHVKELIDVLYNKITPSFHRNRAFLKKYADKIIIVSSGFKDFIVPVAKNLGLLEKNIYANEFLYDDSGNIRGFNPDILLSQDQGKVKLVESLNLEGEVVVIGDGFTDYEIKKAGLAQKFYAFTENVEREKVKEVADHIAPSLEEVLFDNQIERAHSYPKNRINVLVLENIHDKAVGLFKQEGYSVEVIGKSLDEQELCEKIKDVSIICIRSKTHITKKVLEHANRLLVVGAFCIGTNQIDLEECQEKGVAVFNAPFSNTRSVVELAMGQIIMLMRNTFDTSMKMHQGRWNKSAKNSFEVRGKKLGIIGYGNIGAQLSVLAESFGMKVYYYDIIDKLALGNVERINSMEELLKTVDIVTLHVDGRPENKNIFGAREFELMKKGSVFINLSRGHVVDIPALKDAIDSGKLLGASIDVFPSEPKKNDDDFESELMGCRNTILTSHVGGSTQEAQENIAEFVPGKIIDYVNTGSSVNGVTLPEIQLPRIKDAHRLMHIHRNVPGILAKVNNILAKHDTNILGQTLKTNEKIGYLITSVDKAYSDELLSELKTIEGTIRFRVLY